jgi:hypothetical protein
MQEKYFCISKIAQGLLGESENQTLKNVKPRKIEITKIDNNPFYILGQVFEEYYNCILLLIYSVLFFVNFCMPRRKPTQMFQNAILYIAKFK